jgi:hypothetical protein
MKSVKIFIKWHLLAWRIARRIPWSRSVWIRVIYVFGFFKAIGIYLGLVNLRLSDITDLEWISNKPLIKICGT